MLTYPARKHHDRVAELSFANLYCQIFLLSTLHKYTLTRSGIHYRLYRFLAQSYRFGYHNSSVSNTNSLRFGFPFSMRYGRIQQKKPRDKINPSVRKRHEEPIIRRKYGFGGMNADRESHAAHPSSLLLTSSCLHTLTTAFRRITDKNGNIPTGQQHVIHMK